MFESTLEKVLLRQKIRKLTSLRIDSCAKVTIVIFTFLGMHGQCRIFELGHSHAEDVEIFLPPRFHTHCMSHFQGLIV